MPNYPSPILEIVNGSEIINLLARGKGWHLTGFRPRTAEVKSGGTWQSSPLSNGRQPVSYRYDNIIDTWTATADGYDEDGLIELAQDLERAGVAALDYWVSDWAATPVYIRARGPKETGTRYAVIHQIRVPEYADQFRQPMFGIDQPVMDGISIIIEHGQWQNVAPGSSECVQVSNVFDWAVESWSVNTTTPTGNVLCLKTLSNGRLLAGTDDTAKIYYSDDNGATWSLLDTLGADAADRVEAIEETTTNNYVWAGVSGSAGGGGLHRSADGGANWSRLTITGSSSTVTDVYNVVASTNQSSVQIWAGHSGGIGSASRWFGTTSFSRVDILATSTAWGMCQLASGYVLMSTSLNLYRSSETSSTGAGYVSTGTGPFTSIIQTSSGRILAATSSGAIYATDNANGDSGTWSLIWSGSATTIWSLVQMENGTIYAGDDGKIWRSFDDGTTWEIETENPAGDVFDLTEGDNAIFASDDDSIWKLALNSVEAGSSASCNNQVYVANKKQDTGLTHVKVYDSSGTSYTDVYPASSFPFDLLPTAPATNDAIYFGISTSLTDSGPFSSLIFDIDEPFVGWSSVGWQYWNGSAWSALTVTDKTGSLLNVGVNSVVWIPPSDWATTTVNSVSGYWVRFLVSTVGASPEPPSQQNRNVYTVVNPYVEIAAAQIGGDIPALARIQIENVSDTGGPGGSAPTLYANRIIAGLRSYDRGSLFTAYLNASDEQNPVGVTVTAGTDTSFVDAVGAPSGRLAQWSPTGTASWVTILTFSLATTIATQYYGTFRAFLRARQSGGTAGQMQLRLRTSSGSGGISITTDALEFANTNDFQILDFGQLTIPISAYLKPTELGDTLTIAVQGYTSSTTPDCNMYDLVLIPVDEWAADLTDGENSVDSELGSGNYIDIDSVTYPKRQLRNTVKASGTGYTKAIWQQVANGPAILQANARQRLWFLSLRTASAGSSDWRSEPDVVHRVQVWSAERYRWARGSR